MSAALTRRQALAGAAVLAFPVAGSRAADLPVLSPIAELIADYHWRYAEFEAISDEYEELFAATCQPAPQVQVGIRRVVIRDEDGRQIGEEPMSWTMSYTTDIERFYQPMPCFTDAENERRAERCAGKVAELAQLWVDREAQEELDGVGPLGRAVDAAYEAAAAVRDTIFGYGPRTIAELAEKNAFIREWLAPAGRELEERDLALIFGARMDAA